MAYEDHPSTQDPVCNVTDEYGIMDLFDELSGLVSQISD